MTQAYYEQEEIMQEKAAKMMEAERKIDAESREAAGHTPGLWTIDEMAAQEAMQEGIEKGDWIAVESEEAGGHVAYCHPANARLIAAAPEMLEVLQVIHANAGESPEWIRMRIDAVMGKVKGGAQ